MAVSLKANGLRCREGLACPAGGQHHVVDTDVIVAATQGGGTTICLSCGETLHLDLLPSDD
jgi:transcription elongation factor Elf1